MSVTTGKTKIKNKRKIVSVGFIYVQASFNNTIITVTDIQGNVIVASSAGANNFKGAKKATPFAAQVTSEKVLNELEKYGMKTVSAIRLKGAGSQREAALRAILTKLQERKIATSKIEERSSIPHNGVRRRKQRRT